MSIDSSGSLTPEQIQETADVVVSSESGVENLAAYFGQTYYGRAWEALTADERIGLRARARRYLGL